MRSACQLFATSMILDAGSPGSTNSGTTERRVAVGFRNVARECFAANSDISAHPHSPATSEVPRPRTPDRCRTECSLEFLAQASHRPTPRSPRNSQVFELHESPGTPACIHRSSSATAGVVRDTALIRTQAKLQSNDACHRGPPSSREQMSPAGTPNVREWNSSRPGAQAACCFRCSALKRTPFVQTSRVIAAILRANVSRAVCGFIPRATKASSKFWKGPVVAAARVNQASSARSSKMQSQQRSWPPHTGHSSKSQLGTWNSPFRTRQSGHAFLSTPQSSCSSP